MYQKQLAAYFASHRQELVDDICRLVAIESVGGEAQPGMPYGVGPARALHTAMELAQRMGFSATDYDGYVLTVDMNDKPAQLDILAHLDVVPGGEGWTVTTPFAPVEKDGLLYGRGVADDKGPAVAALYAMRAVKELGIPPSKNVRLILGTDEERGSSDIEHYYQQNPEAPMTFSPDADFPLINIEKGRVLGRLSAQWESSELLPRILTLHCGERPNVVPQSAEAAIAGLTAAEVSPIAAEVTEQTGICFHLTDTDMGMRLLAEGIGAHASTPQQGRNALTGLLELLCRLPLQMDGAMQRLSVLHQLFPHGEFGGESAGMVCRNTLSGDTTLAFTVLHLQDNTLHGEFDSRTAISAVKESTADVLAAKLAENGITPDFECTAPHHVSAESPLVQELLHCYERYTGNKGVPLAMGGFTYVHDLKNGVAFGCTMPGFEPHMHGADECVDIDTLLLSGQMFAQAIIDLCR